jgi:transcriptional regulator with XRE-family HTH domain
MTITPQQMKTGRQLLGWSRSDLGGVSGVSSTTTGNFEKGGRKASVLDLSTVRRVLEAAGVEFLQEHGAAGARLWKTP